MKTYHLVVTESEQHALINALIFYLQFFGIPEGVDVEAMREAFRLDGYWAIDSLAGKIARLE